MGKLRPGAWAWAGLAAYVATTDAWLLRHGRETLSQVFGEALRHPIKRIPVIALWAIITLHLFSSLLPSGMRKRLQRVDPIGRLARALEVAADEIKTLDTQNRT